MKSKNIIIYQRKRLAKKVICKGEVCKGPAFTLRGFALCQGITSLEVEYK